MKQVNKTYPVIAWWSGGITSAVACHIAIELFGSENMRVVFIDTKNEDEDTYRFKGDCETWYGLPIETISNEKYQNIEEVWYSFLSLNVAHGAICSTELKRCVRELFQKSNPYSYQVFGYEFEAKEMKRAISMKKNYPEAMPIFPLLMYGIDKKVSIEMALEYGIDPPRAYRFGLNNNNCLKRGCVQGGIGYWQKMKTDFPEKFDRMAQVEHDLTNLKGQPVTMLKDQSKGGGLVFLKPHPHYLDIKDISMMKGRPSKPLMECNGFCGTNDLVKNETELEINFAE